MTDGGTEGMIRAGGAIVWRGDRRAPEVAVVHRPRYDDWSFPKGKLKPGEHVASAAVREIAEETGFSVALGRRLPPVHYTKGGRLKRVDYWVAEAVEEVAWLPSDEVDGLEWLPVERARKRLTYEWDAGLLQEFTAAPPDTTPLVVVRHGYAGNRHDWDGDDDLRPLDDEGERQARIVAELLQAFRPASLVSSPSRRCVQTLLPYAARQSMKIRTERLLTETEYDSSLSLEFTLSLLDQGGPSALCGHGKVLPELIASICERRFPGRFVNPELRKGAVAAIHHSGGRVVSVDRYRT